MAKNHRKLYDFLGFTLVELIVVVTILAILATIAFLSFQGYSSSARDSLRLSDLKNISKGLELYSIKSGVYPLPENISGTGIIGGIPVNYVGTLQDRLAGVIGISKAPLDPIINKNYPYGVTWNQNMFQIAATLESGDITSYNEQLFIDTAFASSNATALVNGNYKGILLFNSGSGLWASNVPSLIYTNTGSVNLMSDSTMIYITNKSSNLPYVVDLNSTGVLLTGNQILSNLTGKTSSLTTVQIPTDISSYNNAQSTSISMALGYSAPTIGIAVYGDRYLTTNNTTLGWSSIDINCTKPDITINGTTWAGCNSTLGTMDVANVNEYTGVCNNYVGVDAATTLCQSMVAKEDWTGITTNTAYAPAHTDNIYGKLYRFDTDIKSNCVMKQEVGTGVYAGDSTHTNCPCPNGWHIPSEQEFLNLTTYFNGGTLCEISSNILQCSGIGWMNQVTKNSSNNIIQALGIPLGGMCYSGSCANRGTNGPLWSSTESGANSWRRVFNSTNDSIYREVKNQTYSFPVRCLKDY